MRVVETKIDATVLLAVGHFTLEGGKAVELGDHTRLQRLLDQGIGPRRIDTGQSPLRGFADFPGAGQFTFRVVGATEPDLSALDHAVEHRPGVRTVNRDHLAANGFDIGEKPLVASNQPALLQGRIEAHQPCQLRRPRAIRSTASCKRGRLWV
ncbi:hypothetical protein D3C78_1321120 [compost metagenome]